MSILNTKPGTVYFLKSNQRNEDGCNGLYKIGVTSVSVPARIKALQTGNPHPIEEYHSFRSETAGLVEYHLHKMLSEKSVRGEWYLLTGPEIDEIIVTAIQYSNRMKKSAARVHDYEQTLSNGKTVPATDIALDLHKKITELLKRKTVLNADQQILKWKLNELTSNSSGITGITNVKVTDPKPSFKVRVLKTRYPDIHEQLLNKSYIKCPFKIIRSPTIFNYPVKRAELVKAKQKIQKIHADKVQKNVKIPATEEAVQLHEQYIFTSSEISHLNHTLTKLELQLRDICGENEMIRGVCRYKRTVSHKLNTENIRSMYPVEYRDCFTVSEPVRRLYIISEKKKKTSSEQVISPSAEFVINPLPQPQPSPLYPIH